MSTSHRPAPDFVRAMAPVARELLGEPTEHDKTKQTLRFGRRGSLVVDLKEGVWHDHEQSTGGGVLDLVMGRKSLDKEAATEWLRKQGHLPAAAATGRTLVETYDYTDTAGALVFQVVRYDPKDFRQRRPNGHGDWIWKMAGVELCLYRLPEIAAAVAARQVVFIVEGEKAANALAGLGIAATCSPGGAGKWRVPYGKVLASAEVVILPDNDPQATAPDGSLRWHADGRPIRPGQDHADDVARKLADVAANVRILNLPGLPLKGDVADWIAAGGTAETLMALLPMAEAVAPTNAAAPHADTDALTANNIAAVVEDFNARYMVVSEGGKAVILQPGHDPNLNRRYYDRLSVRDLHVLYMNQLIRVGEKENGEAVFKSKADVWLRHADRRQFIHGVTFDPSSTDRRPGVLNLWEGWAKTPRKGDWTLLRDHVGKIVCNGNALHFHYLMGWMARLFQQPGKQGEVAVVMKGPEGAGKGTLAKAIKEISGQHGIAINNPKHLVGNFNGHLRDAVFLFADEAFFAGDKASIGTLKSLITEPYLTVEAKFQNAVQQPNFLHVMMASNEEWVVPASLEARRFFVLEVSDFRKGDHAYFAAIQAQMDAGGYEAMLHDLLAWDLSKFNVRAVPQTEGLQRQKSLSLPIPEAWWKDCLERGYVFRSRLGLEEEFAKWAEKVSTELLFASYMEFASARHERHPMSRETLGRFLRRMRCEPRRLQDFVVGEHITEVAGPFGTTRGAKVVTHPRPPGYSLGTLDAARTAFTDCTGLNVDWELQGNDDEP